MIGRQGGRGASDAVARTPPAGKRDRRPPLPVPQIPLEIYPSAVRARRTCSPARLLRQRDACPCGISWRLERFALARSTGDSPVVWPARSGRGCQGLFPDKGNREKRFLIPPLTLTLPPPHRWLAPATGLPVQWRNGPDTAKPVSLPAGARVPRGEHPHAGDPPLRP